MICPNSAKLIPLLPLSRGKFAIVDAEDYERLSQHKWRLIRQPRNYYARRHFKKNGKWLGITMHKAIMGVLPGTELDHINHNGLDNRKCNLRFCTHAQNIQNQRLRNGRRYKGVSRKTDSPNKWGSQITCNSKSTYLGRFKSEDEAARAYDVAAKRLFGDFACLNFPEKAVMVS